MGNKALDHKVIAIYLVLVTLLLVVFFGFRGNTFAAEKANIQYNFQIHALEAAYQWSIKGRSLPVNLTNVYYSRDSRYSMRYPNSWEMRKQSPSIWLITGKEGTSAFLSNINIQAIKTQQYGGKFINAKDFINSMTKHHQQNSNFNVVQSGSMPLYLLNGKPITAEFIVFTYSNRGLAFKQWQVAVNRGDGLVFYVWAYNAPLSRFQTDLLAAQEMLKSFNIF